MKKLFAIILSVAMLATMSVTAFAAEGTVNKADGSQDIDINATYIPGSDAQTVYKVDIAWGSMEFTYTGESAGVWNPDTHTYDGRTYQGKWSCETDANKITVKNHSNAAVTVGLTSSLNDGITGEFKNTDGQTVTSLSLATAVATSAGNPPTAMAYFNVTGGSISQSGKIGTITITIE